LTSLTESAPGQAALTPAEALAEVATRAGEYDAAPRFPAESFQALSAVGIPALAADREHIDFQAEVSLIRTVAAADASVARILDGHLNGVERLSIGAPAPLLESELEAVAQGRLLGVWGADPAPGEGEPARLGTDAGGGLSMSGVKTFCSGAGGVERALVIARDEGDNRRLAYVDVTSGTRIDHSWYRASGLRASESHRVEFLDAPVLCVLGGPDEIMREPWFSRDAVRTSATWAGIADGILEATTRAVAAIELDELRLHSLGRMRLAQSSIDRWLDHTVAALEDVERLLAAGDAASTPRALAGECRLALAEACRTIAAESVRVSGSRGLAGGGPLDRGRRDLDLFLLQHRLDPLLVGLGRATVEAQRP
jgi:alkylation response protein AidB-like acyl-CoA dehydrogenase